MVSGGSAVRARLVEVGAHRGADQAQELAQDAVLVQARHRRQRAFDARADRLLGRLARRLMTGLRSGLKRRWKQLEQVARHAGVAVQRVGDVAQPERRAELAQEGGVGPQRRDLAPVGARRR